MAFEFLQSSAEFLKVNKVHSNDGSFLSSLALAIELKSISYRVFLRVWDVLDFLNDFWGFTEFQRVLEISSRDNKAPDYD